jgi:hypothetical protein
VAAANTWPRKATVDMSPTTKRRRHRPLRDCHTSRRDIDADDFELLRQVPRDQTSGPATKIEKATARRDERPHQLDVLRLDAAVASRAPAAVSLRDAVVALPHDSLRLQGHPTMMEVGNPPTRRLGTVVSFA